VGGKRKVARRNIPRLTEKEITDYIVGRFEEVKKSRKVGALVSFQAMNKYMIMSKDQEQLRILGSIVAKYKKGTIKETIEEYERHLKKALAKSPTTKMHYNVILHIFGYFSKYFGQNEREEFLRLLEEFKKDKIAVGEVLAEISPMVYRFNNTYLASQSYFLLYSDIYN